jgi:hypothetical protein
MTTRYAPPDVDEAVAAYNATCGPAALAAIVQQPLMRLRTLFPGFPRKCWVNPTAMMAALDRLNAPFENRKRAWPTYGLAFLQWDGPWLAPGIPVGAAYKHTHWIAVVQDVARMIYDINADGWLPGPEWEQRIVPAILAEEPEASGTYFVRWSCQVLRQRETPLAPDDPPAT